VIGDTSSRWDVPISYSTDAEDNFNNTRPSTFLLADEDSTTFKIKDGSAKWIVLNNQASGTQFFISSRDV